MDVCRRIWRDDLRVVPFLIRIMFGRDGARPSMGLGRRIWRDDLPPSLHYGVTRRVVPVFVDRAAARNTTLPEFYPLTQAGHGNATGSTK